MLQVELVYRRSLTDCYGSFTTLENDLSRVVHVKCVLVATWNHQSSCCVLGSVARTYVCEDMSGFPLGEENSACVKDVGIKTCRAGATGRNVIGYA